MPRASGNGGRRASTAASHASGTGWRWTTRTSLPTRCRSLKPTWTCGEQLLLVPDGDGEKAVCNFVPFITEAPLPNAFTDGSLVFFTKGMLRTIHNADEFRAILGHEMAMCWRDIWRRRCAMRKSAHWLEQSPVQR